MDKELARRAHAVLMQVLDVAPADRAAHIEEACGDDPSLRARVAELVAALDDSTEFLETPALAQPAATSAQPNNDVKFIGDYRIVRVIGVGGMATVYEALQEHPKRRVALKVMRQGLAQTSAIHRFQYETEILARLQHPGIAQIYEAGTWEKDPGVATPYFTMEYVSDARTVTEYAKDRDLSLSDRLSMFAAVCDAVQHGHQNGVIHRDLKPGNILVDKSGRPKVIDFGVARSADPGEAWITQHADVRHLIGTLNYMSPEQCDGTGAIDIRSDVYSLGVVLFELVCGRLPHNLSGIPLPEALRVVRESSPPRPGTIDPHLRGDVDAIITMAIDKDPDRRYRSAAALGADIRRHLNHQTVEARPPTLVYQCRQFARRNRGVVTAAAIVALTIVAGAIVSARFGYKAWQESQQRRAAELRAVEQRDAAVWNAYVANIAAAFSAYQTGELQQVRTRLASAPEALRGWEWHFLLGLSERSLHTIPAHDDMTFDLIATADRKTLLTAGRDGVVHIWDAATRNRMGTLDARDGGPVYSVALSPDQKSVATGSDDGTIRIWDRQRRELTRTIRAHAGLVRRVAFLDSNLVASSSVGGGGGLWDARTGEAAPGADLGNVTGGLVSSVDGSSLVVWNAGGDIWLRDQQGTRVTRQFAFDRRVECVALSPDKQRLAVGGAEGYVTVWDTVSGEIAYELQTPMSVSNVSAIAFSASGDQLAVGQYDRRIHLFSMENGRRRETLNGHEEAVSALAFGADGRTLYSSSWDRTVRVWGLEAATRTDYITILKGHTDHVLTAAFSPESTMVASGGRDKTVRLWEPQLALALGTLRGHTAAVVGVTFSPDGRWIASASDDHSVRIWNSLTGKPEAVLTGHGDGVWVARFSPDGRLLATAGDDATIRIWDVAEWRTVRILEGHAKRVISVAFSPDSRTIGSVSRDHTVRVWDTETGRTRWQFDGHSSDVFAVVVSHDGGRLYSGSRDQTVSVLDMSTGELLDTLAGHGQFVSSLSLSPDGSRLAAGSWFGEIVIWDTSQHDVVASFKAHPQPIRSVAFSPNGRWLASASYDESIRLFDAAPPAERLDSYHDAEARRSAAAELLGQFDKEGYEPVQIREWLDARPQLDPRTRSWARLLMLKRVLELTTPSAEFPAGDRSID